MLSAIPQIAQIPGLQAALDAKAATSALAAYALLSGGNSWTGDQSFTGGLACTKWLQVTGGTKTTSQPSGDFAETWNAGSVTFTALQVSVTDTASQTASLLANFKVGGVSKFSVTKAGLLTAGAGVFTGVLTAPYLNLSGAIYANNGSLSASDPIADLGQTWNNSGVNFTALKLNVTNTASGSDSRLLDLQVGGASKFYVDKVGTLVGPGTTGGMVFSSPATESPSNFDFAFSKGGDPRVRIALYPGNLLVNTSWRIGWGNVSAGTLDTAFARNAAGKIEVNNGSSGTYRDLRIRELFDSNDARLLTTRLAAVADVASADATDLAEVITLANEIKAQLNTWLARARATGGHGLIAD
jgi:hypothetical protein